MFCSIRDIRTRKVSLHILFAFGLILTIINLLRIDITVLDMVLGIAIGFIVIIISKVTNNKIGMGDGFVFIITGISLGIYYNLLVFGYSMLLACFFSLIYISIKGIRKGKSFPFVPFIFIGYVIVIFSSY